MKVKMSNLLKKHKIISIGYIIITVAYIVFGTGLYKIVPSNGTIDNIFHAIYVLLASFVLIGGGIAVWNITIDSFYDCGIIIRCISGMAGIIMIAVGIAFCFVSSVSIIEIISNNIMEAVSYVQL